MHQHGRSTPAAVGHEVIDRAHAQVGTIFDRLDEAIGHDDRRALTALAEELFRAFESHFVEEERLMIRADYDDERRKAHVRIHHAYTETLITLVAALPEAPPAEFLVELSGRLRESFHDHLIKSDLELALFLNRLR